MPDNNVSNKIWGKLINIQHYQGTELHGNVLSIIFYGLDYG